MNKARRSFRQLLTRTSHTNRNDAFLPSVDPGTTPLENLPSRPFSSSPLCNKCSHLDLHGLLLDPTSDQHPTPLDSLEHVLSKSSSCTLCTLISASIRRSWLLDEHTHINLSAIELSLYSLGTRICVRSSRRPSEITEAMNKAKTASVPELQLMADDAHHLGRTRELHGRVVHDVVDLDLLRTWLGLCERTHGVECAVPWWSPSEEWDLPSAARLLDVQDMALVPARPKSRYVALSYVWGSATDGVNTEYWTTRENLAQRRSPGGIPLGILPTTITDSILLARVLGERYLWIDALCIVQDDSNDKAINISAMDAVYRRAVLTIFSAGGSNAHSPLPGLRPGTRISSQQVAEVQGLRFAISLPASREALARTTWNSRGWTYQELMLSPRRLLFTPSQVLFECNECVWAEDLVAELPDGTCADMTHRLETGVVGRVMFAHRPPKWLRDTDVWVDEYLLSVESYTVRRLTNEGDAVDAFSALTSAIAKAYGLAGGDPRRAFRYGMAITELETALLWQPEIDVPSERREVVDKEGKTRAVFPSWAFTGWRSPVWHGGEDQFLAVHSGKSFTRIGESLVDAWYIVNDDGGLTCLDVRRVERFAVDPAWGKQAYEVPKWEATWRIPSNIQLIPGTLIFKTWVARLSVTTAGEESGVSGKHHSLFSIVADEQKGLNVIGRILLPNYQLLHEKLDFAVIGRSFGTQDATWASSIGVKASYPGFLLYVIALRPADDVDVQVSERAGVGVVFEKAWYEVHAEEKVVMCVCRHRLHEAHIPWREGFHRQG